MAPDGSPLLQSQVDEATQPDKAINPHLKISLPLKADNRSELVLLLQQLVRRGQRVGVLAGAFAARLNDLNDDELFADFEKKRKAMEDALKFDIKYEQIKDKIDGTREAINQKIRDINDEINDEARGGSGGGSSGSGSGGSKAKGRKARFTSGQSSEERIEALRRQRDKLELLDEKLANVDTELQSASKMSELNTIETKVDSVAENVGKVHTRGTFGVDLSFRNPREDEPEDKPGANI